MAALICDPSGQVYASAALTIVGWEVAGAGLNGLEKKTISCRESNHGYSVSQPLTVRPPRIDIKRK
jgi:hypothetical protein